MNKYFEKISADYYSLVLEAAHYHMISVPFAGTPIFCKVRELTQAQIMACGDFSLIETLEDKIISDRMINTKNRKKLVENMLAYSKRNHNIVKASLINPTYDQIFEIIGVNPIVKKDKENLLRLKAELKKCKGDKERKVVEEQIDECLLQCEYILPIDFMSHVVSFALGIDKSDIKSVSEKMLLDAAILAEKGHNNPADHIDGMFTPFMKDDINRRAWYLLMKHREERK